MIGVRVEGVLADATVEEGLMGGLIADVAIIDEEAVEGRGLPTNVVVAFLAALEVETLLVKLSLRFLASNPPVRELVGLILTPPGVLDLLRLGVTEGETIFGFAFAKKDAVGVERVGDRTGIEAKGFLGVLRSEGGGEVEIGNGIGGGDGDNVGGGD